MSSPSQICVLHHKYFSLYWLLVCIVLPFSVTNNLIKAILQIAIVLASTISNCNGQRTEEQCSELESKAGFLSAKNKRIEEQLRKQLRDNQYADEELKAVYKIHMELQQELRGLNEVKERNMRLERDLETIRKEVTALNSRYRELSGIMEDLYLKRDDSRNMVQRKDQEIMRLTQEVSAQSFELEKLRAARTEKSSK